MFFLSNVCILWREKTIWIMFIFEWNLSNGEDLKQCLCMCLLILCISNIAWKWLHKWNDGCYFYFEIIYKRESEIYLHTESEWQIRGLLSVLKIIQLIDATKTKMVRLIPHLEMVCFYSLLNSNINKHKKKKTKRFET